MNQYECQQFIHRLRLMNVTVHPKDVAQVIQAAADEIERLRGMIAYAAGAPSLESAVKVLMDALDGIAGAEGKAARHAR